VKPDPNDPAWAWVPFQPDAVRPWDLPLAAHLYRRAAFGGTWPELQRALSEGPQATIDKLVHPTPKAADFNRLYDDYENAAAASDGYGSQAWWLRRMIESPQPLQEQVTLFWHNHFGISNVHVKSNASLCRHTHVLRQHGLSSFEELLGAIMAEPAVWTCLGAGANGKRGLSDSSVRILMDQYTLGPGCCSDLDVREGTRALSGWIVSQGELRFVPGEYDATPKKILGQEGDFDRKALVGILAKHPATGQWLAQQLVRWFISDTAKPSESLLAPLAKQLTGGGNTAKGVEMLLRSNLFFSAEAYRQKVRSPVELALGIIRPLEGRVGTVRLAADLAELGQELYEPPTIRGWAGGLSWLNPLTVLGRAKLAEALLAEQGAYEGKLDPAGVANRHGHPAKDGSRQFLVELYLQGDLAPGTLEALPTGPSATGPTDTRSIDPRQLAARLATLPEFQLA
jgi:uncharacterized protein (DUF1800 family)